MTADSEVRRDLETVRAEDTDQREWNDRVAAATADEGFQAWLAMMEPLLEIDFNGGDVVGLPDPAYTQEGLRIAEKAALDRWPDARSAFEGDNAEVADRFIRFVGETLARAFQGVWLNAPSEEVRTGEPSVELPFRSIYITPRTLFTAALARRTGEEWARVYLYAQEDFDKWKAVGGE